MADALAMHVLNCSKEGLHVLFGCVLREDGVLLCGQQVKQLASADVLHNNVDEGLINVCFIVLDNVWMVKGGQYLCFLHDGVNVIHLLLIQNLDCHLEFRISLVVGQVYFSKSTGS